MKRKHNDKTIQYTPSATNRKVSYTWFAWNSFKVNNTQKTSLKSIPTLFKHLTVCRDSCMLCCRSVEYPPGASRQGEAPAGPIPATPTGRPGILSLQSTIKGDSGQLQWGGEGGWRPLYSAPLVFI